jgi:hypothetical protein
VASTEIVHVGPRLLADGGVDSELR